MLNICVCVCQLECIFLCATSVKCTALSAFLYDRHDPFNLRSTDDNSEVRHILRTAKGDVACLHCIN